MADDYKLDKNGGPHSFDHSNVEGKYKDRGVLEMELTNKTQLKGDFSNVTGADSSSIGDHDTDTSNRHEADTSERDHDTGTSNRHEAGTSKGDHDTDTSNNDEADTNIGDDETSACDGDVAPGEVSIVDDSGKTNDPPDGGWGWFVVLGACYVHVLMGGFERSNGIIYLQLLEKYGRSATETAWVISIFSTLRLFAGPVVSALVNRFSCRIVCFMGAVTCTLGLFLSVFAPNIYYLYFSYGLLGGFGRSMTYTPSLIIVGYYFNKRRGLAVGLATSGVGFGTFLFPPLFEVLFDTYGHAGTFLILSAITSNFFICACLFRPLSLTNKLMEFDRRRKLKLAKHTDEDVEKDLLDKDVNTFIPPGEARSLMSANKDPEMTASTLEISANMKITARRPLLFKRQIDKLKLVFKDSNGPTREKKKFIDLSLFRNFGFSCLCFQLLLFTLSFNTTFVFLPALAKEKGVPQIYGAYLISILGILDAVSRITMSVILDLKRVKKYRLIVYNAVMFIIGGISITLPSLTEFWQFCIIAGLYGILSGTYISQKSVVCVDILGLDKLASSFGLLLLFQGISAFIGPALGAFLKDRLGSYDMAFYVGSCGIFVGGFVMLAGNIWLYKQRKKQADSGAR